MLKKVLLSISIFSFLIFMFSICFANTMEEEFKSTTDTMMDNAENSINKSIDNAENTMNNIEKDIVNSSDNMVNTFEETTDNLTDDVKLPPYTDNSTYTATRTISPTEPTFLGINSSSWVWIIVALTTVIIFALVRYFYLQNNDTSYDYIDRE